LKAAVYHTPGSPEVLTLEEVETPKPGKGEALVRVDACGVNRIDIWARSGRYKTDLPRILGTDIAGEVASLGPATEGVSVGASVVVYPMLSDGSCAYCLRGELNRCLNRGYIGVATDGGYAEFVRVPSANLVELGRLDPKVAAALPINFGTAWKGLSSLAQAGPKDTVLVWGAAGGVGHAAVQVAKLLGATVIAAVGDDRKIAFVESMGADYAVNHATQDIVKEVRALTNGLGASVVFDHVGGDTWQTSIECLARGGKLVTLGLTSGPRSDVDVRRVYQDELRIIGEYGQSKDDLTQVVRYALQGELRPSICQELPLESARRAHEVIESRSVQGKVLLVP
jgi:NADPH:quinone reductase-like Zn-dependent oxidoreductase